MTPEILQHYCENLLKPQYIAYRRSKEELLYKLEVSLISSACLEIPITERLSILSWYTKEKHAHTIRFEHEEDILRCFITTNRISKTKFELLNMLEGILEYWFEADFKNCLTAFLHGSTFIHIAIDKLPTLKRPPESYMAGFSQRNH